MSEAEFVFEYMNYHQVLIIFVVETRVLSSVTDSLQERRFSSISSTDYKDTKARVCRSEVVGITVAHGRWAGEDCVRTLHRGSWEVSDEAPSVLT